MRIPGGALLITIGILFLWVAITGKITRFNDAWNYVKGGANLPNDPAASATPDVKPISNPLSNPLNNVVDPATWHVATTAFSLIPEVALFLPGGAA
jgi:hypothetical protein